MVALIEDTQENRMKHILAESHEKIKRNKQRLQAVNTALHKERINLFLANVKLNSQRIGEQLLTSLSMRAA